MVELLVQGNEKAFDVLYKRYAEQLYHFFYKMLYQDQELATDFCQTLFMKIFEKANAFDAHKKFSTWIYAVASNMCKNEYRRKGRTKPIIHLEDNHRISAAKAPAQLDSQIFNQQLEKAINKLDDKHRLCFVLRYKQEKTIAEISDIIGSPQGTIKSRIHYALKKLSVDLSHFDPKQKKASNE